MSETQETQDVLTRYFRAWTGRDTPTVRSLLSPSYRFDAGGMVIEGRDAFLDNAAYPADATTTLVAEAYQGDAGFQMYDAVRDGAGVRIVEHLTVDGGMVTGSTMITDPAAFTAFMTR